MFFLSKSDEDALINLNAMGRVCTSRVVKDALIFPDLPCAYLMNSGSAVDDTYLTRGVNRDVLPFDVSLGGRSVCSVVEMDSVVFLYFYSWHFGHFLTESLALFWYLRKLHLSGEQGVKIILNCPRGVEGVPAEVVSWLKNQFDVLFLYDLPGPVRVKCLHVPMPSMINRHAVSVEHFQALSWVLDAVFNVDFSGFSNGDFVYISRSKLPDRMRRIEGEARLELLLRERGWTIYHPQEHDISHQLATYAAAKVISGCLGSAYHLLMYFGLNLSAKLIPLTFGSLMPSYILQFRAQGVEYRFLECLRVIEGCRKKATNRDLEFCVDVLDVADAICFSI